MLVVVCEVLRGYFAQECNESCKKFVIIGYSLPNVVLAAFIRYQRVILNEVLKKDQNLLGQAGLLFRFLYCHLEES